MPGATRPYGRLSVIGSLGEGWRWRAFCRRRRRKRAMSYPCRARILRRSYGELGVGLGLAKLADPNAIPDRLFGDFVETLFELGRTTRPEPDSDRAAGQHSQ